MAMHKAGVGFNRLRLEQHRARSHLAPTYLHQTKPRCCPTDRIPLLPCHISIALPIRQTDHE
jgi:hypothetical protein